MSDATHKGGSLLGNPCKTCGSHCWESPGVCLPCSLRTALAEKEDENIELRIELIGAHLLADKVNEAVTRGSIGSRSAIADALLDFRNPPESNPLAAENAALRAEVEEGRKHIQLAILNAPNCGADSPVPRWSIVGYLFGLGSNSAAKLCEEYGLDSTEVIRPTTDQEEGEG